MKSKSLSHPPGRRAGYETAIGLLRFLGVPEKMVRGRPGDRWRGFWNRTHLNHLACLEWARKEYRTRMRRVHPDRPGGSVHKAMDLNLVKQRLEHLFRKHGYE